MAIVTIATDYGTADGYAAAVKGVIKSVAPRAEIVDVTHELSSLFKTALVLSRYYGDFPPGTVHLVVIDPTVGTARRAIAGRAHRHYFVGPDNGIFSRVAGETDKSEWVEIDPAVMPRRSVSPTFHGRDIFAPAAARLAEGSHLGSLGRPILNPMRLLIPEPRVESGNIFGEIIDIDSFGNLIINILGTALGSGPRVVFNGTEIAFVRTFADVDRGKPLAYIGSLGYLEIAINMGRAAEFFGATIGSKVTVIK